MRYYSKDGTIRAVNCGGDGEKTLFEVFYNGSRYPVYEEHKISLYKWARGLHGNPPAGTPYGYFRATHNGKRVIAHV